MPVSVESVVMCDDIRKEASGKDLLIGVYGGGLVVPSYPMMIQAAFWIELSTPVTENIPGAFRVTTPSGNPPIDVDFVLQVHEAGTSVLVIGGLPLALEHDGDVILSLRLADGEMLEIKRKYVRRRS